MMHVYVAGPYSSNPLACVYRACDVADELDDAGHTWFIPHLSHFHDQRSPRERTWDDWMKWCLAWVERCDAVLRLPGESKGADIEVARARELGLPVVESVADLP